MPPAPAQVAIYESPDGAAELRVRADGETVWLRQAQIAELFGVERSVVTKHLGNIFRIDEVEEKSNVQILHIANSDRPVKFYSLDIVLAVGYRVNARRGIAFRRWASGVLKNFLTRGIAVDEARLAQIPREKIAELRGVIALLDAARSKTSSKNEADGLLEVISKFARTWLALDRYDRGDFPAGDADEKSTPTALDPAKAESALDALRADLIAKNQATEIFARERTPGALRGILAAVAQTWDGRALYPTVADRAAHLLYFLVKDHPFTDGNKRSGALLFVLFLQKNRGLPASLTDAALAALTLLVAESAPDKKSSTVGLIRSMLEPGVKIPSKISQ